MLIWIIKDGVTLVFRSYLNITINENLISGLLGAINSFVISEFNQSIDSINMGGFYWVYNYEEENRLLYICADTPDIEISTLNSRLNFVKQLFKKSFSTINWEIWSGDIEIFQNFKNKLDEYHNNWKAAENLNLFTDLYDLMGVFQNVLNLLHSILQKQLDDKIRDDIYNEVILFLEKYKKRLDVITAEEMGKIEFSKEAGFNLFNINPNNCDISVARRMLMDIILEVIKIIKEILGQEASSNLFIKSRLYSYIFTNLDLMKKLEIDKFLLQTLLL
jgi:hypothetical protein